MRVHAVTDGRHRKAIIALVIGAVTTLGCCGSCLALWVAGPALRRSMYPSEPGVYLTVEGGWRRLTGHDRDAFFGRYPSTRSVEVSSLPRCVPTCQLLIVDMPSIDPTRVHFGITLMNDRPWDPQINEARPAPLHVEGDGVYSAAIADDDLDPGDAMLMALVARGTGHDARAFFFVMHRPEASR